MSRQHETRRISITPRTWTPHCSLALIFVLAGWRATIFAEQQNAEPPKAEAIFSRVDQHKFHPLNAEGTFTNDRDLGSHGVADLNDPDGRIRLLAIGDLVRLLPDTADDVARGLEHENPHVRQIAAAACGIARLTSATGRLEKLLTDDPSPLVRCQAAMSLGQIESTSSLKLLERVKEDDRSRDVRHQCALAIGQIETSSGATEKLRKSFLELTPEDFGSLKSGDQSPEFTLHDSNGVPWKLSDANDDGWVVLVWIFADWCPVCHGEFRDLMEMQDKFEKAGVSLVTIECHDVYRCRVMVAKETQPDYWFTKDPFALKYQTGIWWRHLSDPAGRIGARYGVEPMAFAVHGEYVNRPSTIIIDPEGTVRLAYYGTFWGDRPSIPQTLEMIQANRFDFRHPQRRAIPPR